MDFNPANNIWRADDGRVFSSARMSEISPDDPDIAAFEEAGGAITTWARDASGEQTRAALDEVLKAYGIGQGARASLPDISLRQFATGLWTDKIISFAECEAYVAARTIPAALQGIVDHLPDDDTGDPTPRKDAILILRGATAFEFRHPLVETVRQTQTDWTPERLAERWAAWAAL